MSDASAPPAEFRRAVAALNAMHPRPELFVTALDAPPWLAPFTCAFSVEADAGRPASEDLDEPDTSGRLILLHDPPLYHIHNFFVQNRIYHNWDLPNTVPM